MTDAELAGEAYVAGYPLLVTSRTMQNLGALIGVNSLFWQTSLSGPDSRIIVAPNRDTLYSVAILDLRSGPLVLELPEVAERYFTYQLLDAWTESFAYVGTRTTGGRAGTWVIAPAGWRGELPDGAELVEAPTPQVFLLGRFLVDDDADVANVLDIRDSASLRPLAEVTGSDPGPPLPPLGTAPGTAQDLPTDATSFDELVKVLAVNPPTTSFQRELFEAAEDRLGLVPGTTPAGGGDPERRALLDAGAQGGRAAIDREVASRSTLLDGWAVNTDIGTYGDDLALRAFVSRIGWGANVPEEAVYPVARVDVEGEPLDGSTGAYSITFPPGGLPPVEAFWSLSVYGADMFFADHPAGRWTIGDRSPDLVPAEDGSVEIVLSHDEPAEGPANWLPVPDGPFILMLRLYLPGPEILEGTYRYPGVTRE